MLSHPRLPVSLMLLFIEPPFSDLHPTALVGEGSETSAVKISGQTFRLSRVPTKISTEEWQKVLSGESYLRG